MMKKGLAVIVTIVMVLGIGMASAFAAGKHFTDANGDGICDTCGASASCGRYFVDADGDGVCDACGVSASCGKHFVDADGDGVCDAAGTRSGNGMGRKAGFRGGRGK